MLALMWFVPCCLIYRKRNVVPASCRNVGNGLRHATIAVTSPATFADTCADSVSATCRDTSGDTSSDTFGDTFGDTFFRFCKSANEPFVSDPALRVSDISDTFAVTFTATISATNSDKDRQVFPPFFLSVGTIEKTDAFSSKNVTPFFLFKQFQTPKIRC